MVLDIAGINARRLAVDVAERDGCSDRSFGCRTVLVLAGILLGHERDAAAPVSNDVSGCGSILFLFSSSNCFIDCAVST